MSTITSKSAEMQKTIQLKVGKVIEAFKARDNYLKDNQNIDKNTDERYLKFEQGIITAKQNLINISPTAKERFTSPSMLPDLAPHASNEIWGCVMQDIEKGLHEPKIDVTELQNIAAPITVKVQATDKKGNPLETSFETENGETIVVPVLEDMQVFAFKGNSLEEVATNLGKLISIANQQASEQIREVREELETLAPQETNQLGSEEVKKIIDAELAVKTTNLSKNEILNVLNSPEATQILNEKEVKKHYTYLFDEYMEDLKTLHFEQREDGQWYPRQGDKFAETLVTQVNYNQLDAKTNSTKQVQGTVYDALAEYAFRELSQNFSTYNTNNNNLLFSNIGGRNNELNKQFINIVVNSTDLALRKLSTENPNISTQSFYGELPRNKFEPQIKEQTMFDRLGDPNTLYNATRNGVAGIQNLAYGQPQQQQAIPQPQQVPYLGYNVPVAQTTPAYPNYEALPENTATSGVDNIPVANTNPQATYQQPAYQQPKQNDFDVPYLDLSL